MSVLTMERTKQAGHRGDSESPGQLPQSMIERMTLILDLFDNAEVRLTLEGIARTTGLPRSTAHRILDQLVRLHWLDHMAAGYSLGRRSLLLGGRGDHSDLRAAASPYLHNLLVRTGAVIHLGVLEGSRIRYLDKLGGRSASAVPSRVGGSAPAHCTGLGKAMLAWLEPEDVDLLIGDRPLARTEATISELDTLHRELGRIRARGGVATERGEYVPEIACVAAAVRGPDGPIGAISIVAAAGTALERVAPLLVDATRRIAHELHPDVPVAKQRCHSGATVTRING